MSARYTWLAALVLSTCAVNVALAQDSPFGGGPKQSPFSGGPKRSPFSGGATKQSPFSGSDTPSSDDAAYDEEADDDADPEAGLGDEADDEFQQELPPEEPRDEADDSLPPVDDGPLPEPGDGEATDLPPMEEEPTPDPGVELIATAGLGFGSRAFQRPTFRGLQKLPDTPFAAAVVSFRTRLWPRDAFSLDVLIAYRTSMGLVLRELPLYALPQDVTVRVSSSELSVAPTLRLSDSADAVSLAMPLGLSMRSFVPVETQYQTPRYLLLGPHVRVEVLVPFADILRLRAGPELQWIAQVDPALRRDGVVGDGVAVGVELNLAITLSQVVALELAYRESRAFASSKGPLFIDVERFATFGLSGRY